MHACKVINQLPINFLLIDELVNRLFVSALHNPPKNHAGTCHHTEENGVGCISQCLRCFEVNADFRQH